MALTLLISLNIAQAGTLLAGKVIGVLDGDTIDILDASKTTHRVRLTGIDAPEKAQPFGQRAKEHLSDLVFAKQVEVQSDPRAHEFSVQIRGFDAAKTGAKTGVASLIALSSALLRKSVRGGLVVVGEVTLGGTIEPVHNAVTLAELAIEKGAKSLLLPVACRKQLFDLQMTWRRSWISSFIKTPEMRC